MGFDLASARSIEENTGFDLASAKPLVAEKPSFDQNLAETDKKAMFQYKPQAVRATLEMGGATAGGVVGSPIGPQGTIAGAGLGFAGDKLLADWIDEKTGIKKSPDFLGRVSQTGKDFTLGAFFQTLGEGGMVALNTAVKWAKGLGESGIAINSEDVLMKVSEILKNNKSPNPIYAANARNAEDVASQIPGFKPSIGESSGDPGLIKLQRATSRLPIGRAHV